MPHISYGRQKLSPTAPFPQTTDHGMRDNNFRVFAPRIEANIWKFQQITFPFSYLEELKNNINELIGEWGKHEYWDNGKAWPGFNFPMRENILWKVWNTNFPLSLRGRLEVGPLKTPKVVSWSLSKFNQCQGRFTKSFLQRNLLLRVGKHGLWLGKTKGMFYELNKVT